MEHGAEEILSSVVSSAVDRAALCDDEALVGLVSVAPLSVKLWSTTGVQASAWRAKRYKLI